MKSSARDILFLDNHLLIVVKRAGETVQPDLHEEMRAYVEQKFQKPGRAFLEPIHRLDKPVAGIVVFARTSKALSRMHALMREQQIEKIYLAWVEGELRDEEGELEHFLRHGEHRAEIVKEEQEGAKRAQLHYRVLKRAKGQTLVEVSLKTGRYHQIRAQFAAIGHPIVGDAKYGSRQTREAIALIHVRIAFRHPVTQAALSLAIESQPAQ